MNVKVECTFPAGTLRYAKKSYQDSNGNWDGRILIVSDLLKNIAEDKHFEVSGFTVTFDDTDRFFRDMMTAEYRYISGKTVKLLEEDDTVLFEGVVSGWEFGYDTFTLEIDNRLGGVELLLTDTIQLASYASAVDGAIGVTIPIIYGTLTDTVRFGAVECWNTSTSQYLVALHHCFSIDNVYEWNTTTEVYDEIIGGWSIDNNVDGRCYVTYAGGTEDSIRVNVKGSMNALSAQITEPIEALKDLIDNYTAMSYSAAEFAASETLMQLRNYIIGALITEKTLEEYLSEFCYTFSSDFYFNKDSELVINTVDPYTTTSSGTYNERNIVEDSYNIMEDPKEIKNKLKYQYNYNYIDDYYRRLPTTSNATSITNWGEFYDNIALRSTTDDATALDSASRLIIDKKNPKRTVRFKIRLTDGASLDVGSVILVSHPQGVTLNEEKYQIRRMKTNHKSEQITLDCLALPKVGTPFILGDRTTLAADWLTADAADRYYGYLGDRVTGYFSNGVDPAKVLS